MIIWEEINFGGSQVCNVKYKTMYKPTNLISLKQVLVGYGIVEKSYNPSEPHFYIVWHVDNITSLLKFTDSHR